jgi:CubicO group peptidase (beta-lactamase class C family)
MRHYLVIGLCLILSACSVSVNEHHLPYDANTKQVANKNQGFSKGRLQNIDTAMQRYIDQGKLAGISTMVARNGEIVHDSTLGMQDRAAGLELQKDTIFRIYSMTKPVTAVAALQLWEQGKFHMNDPIAWYLPELANLKVYVSGSGDDMVLEDANAPIRIIDLFMHTAGFSYGFTGSEVDNLYRASPMTQGKVKAEDVMSELAKLPLNHQPGTQWHYGVNTDVIGALVERLSGMKLGEYMQKNIFVPLRMTDTGFSVAPDKAHRLAQIYSSDKNGNTVPMENEPLGDFLSDPEVHNGGGGLVSTMNDYLTFAQMLLNGGEINGVRILGRKTVEYMTSNHLPADLVPYAANSLGEGYGLAVSVTVDEGQSRFLSSEGNFGWGGAASTYFRVDPKENLIIIGMAQFVPIGTHRYHDDLRNLVYQALID